MCRKMICLVSFVFVLALVLTNFAHADLIGWWRFDESSGTIAADSAGGDNDGILFGDDLVWTAGRFGGALSHGGLWDARVEFLTTGMSATAGTVAMWGVLADPQPAQNKYFFGHTTQPQWANRIQLYMNDGDNLLDIGLGNSHELDTDIMELPMEEWVHVALTWDSGNYVVYVDGEEVSSGAYTGLSEIHPVANIGNNGTSGPDKGFAGLLDEVLLYDHALTADEVRIAMNGAASLQAWGPRPNDGALHPETWVILSWNPGVYAVSHDVYFGEDFDDVDSGTGGTFRGNQTATSFLVGADGYPCPDGLDADTTYYWRIDGVEADGVTKHKGMVWSFFIPSDEPSTVSTFHCIGVYWSPQDGSSDNICQVHYRSEGSTGWKEALPLWYDDRGIYGYGGSDFPYPRQYRGSIVNLEPGTTYKIELRLLNTGTTETFTASTWSEDFPIAKTVYLPAGTTNQALDITESGSPDGYILYTYPEGETSTINVNNQEDSCIYVSASYIIIRGLTLREASVHGIRILNNVHDVVIEECDISGWGRLQDGEWGHDLDAAVYSNSPNIERIIVQRNKLHHPRADTNSRKEPARTIPINSIASKGPCAIVFTPRDERSGHYVIRYNEIYSDDDHYFKDGMGDWFNNSYHGFPVRDTDIYGNYIERCWSHGIQSEGANCNVRIWGNYITRTPHKIATRSVTVGPIYVWRNVLDISRAGPAPEHNYGWPAFKAGNFGSWSHGKYYMFHNTILQPPPPDTGSSSGITSGSGNTLGNMFTRNNILHISNDGDNSIFDYDLYNGYIDARPGSERNGIHGVPIYDRNNGDGEFALDSSSPGYDAGEVIPNFNDNYNGAAPDIGAFEAGSPPMVFGVNAYQ